MKNANKIKIKADLVKVLSELEKTNLNKEDLISQTVNRFKEYNQEIFLDVAIKEILHVQKEITCENLTVLISKIADNDLIQKKSLNYLTSNIADEQKYNLIQLLRNSENIAKYNEAIDYFSNPEVLIDLDTKKLLKYAIVNPEAQIDFLDFLTAIEFDDKKILINSLYNDYDGNDLANILYPVLYLDLEDKYKIDIVNKLSELKSFYALDALDWLNEFTQNEELKKAIKSAKAKLKLQGIKSESAQKAYDIIFQNLKEYKCFINQIDGTGHFGLIVSRIRPDETIQMFACVINDENGIKSCFGFNEIVVAEFERVVQKFYDDMAQIEISFELAKTILINAEKQNLKTKEQIPYEYLCFKNLLYNIETFKENLVTIIENDLSQKKLMNEDIEEIYSKNVLEKFFYTIENNENFAIAIKHFVLSLETEKDLSIKKFDNFVQENYDMLLEKKLLIKRLTIFSYILKLSREEKIAQIIYSITKSDELINALLQNMLKKSLYNYFIGIKEKIIAKKEIKNVFKKKEPDVIPFKLDKIYQIISQIEENWIK